MKICSIVGARPQFIKQATISRVVRKRNNINEIIIHTGQHYDKNMSEIFFRELDIPEPNYNLGIGSASHAVQTGQMLVRIEEVLKREKPESVLVYGDTNSTVAGALAASKLHIPVAHIEAGLRSFNRNMPEEINRMVTDAISDILFAPTQTAMKHLENEGKTDISIFSGDVMYDSVLYYSQKIRNKKDKSYYLATIHRPANTDNIDNFKAIMKAFSTFDKDVVLPFHPRIKSLLSKYDIPANVQVIEPVGYLQMLEMVINADLIFTDSGGLQKECYFLQKKCVTLRNETEWIETLENKCNILTGADYSRIIEAEKVEGGAFNIAEKFGDGKAAEKILTEIEKGIK